MRKSLGVKPLIYPQPVLIIATYDENGVANAMNAAWGGTSEENEIMVCLGSHKTTDNLELNKACTISMGTKEQVVACDYVGIKSGNKENKLEKCGWTTTKSDVVNAPIINELPLCFECTLIKIVDECKYFFKVENVNASEEILTDGKIDLSKFHPICFDPSNHTYNEIGSVVGKAFFDGLNIK